MIAYLNDPKIKRKYLNRVAAHRKADDLVQGMTGQDGKGCAVWCTLNKYDHKAYESELGIPMKLARIEDGIFEGLPLKESQAWPENFLKAVTVGADLSGVADKFLHWLLVDPSEGVIRLAKTDETKTAITRVGELYARKISGEEVSLRDWKSARTAATTAYAAAYAAAANAAAANAAAAYAAAANAAANAAAAAAYAAYADAAYADAAAYAADGGGRQKARIRQSEKLIELLQAA